MLINTKQYYLTVSSERVAQITPNRTDPANCSTELLNQKPLEACIHICTCVPVFFLLFVVAFVYVLFQNIYITPICLNRFSSVYVFVVLVETFTKKF
uniref:Uncharacterized protein n=1 Tax=Rhizophora mucronata TaxID=61149 RepID=A0A2P2JWZ9_RHIMU